MKQKILMESKKSTITNTTELTRHLGELFNSSLKVSAPLQMLHVIREKLSARGYREFDKASILKEMGRLQKIMGDLHSEMLEIDELLRKS